MIVFIDNKQTYSHEFRLPRYVLIENILCDRNIPCCLILGTWHHGLKKRIENRHHNYFSIDNISYKRHIGIRRFLSEILFGFQVYIRYRGIIRNATVLVVNDSGIFYNYLFYIMRSFYKYKIVLDSNDIWPETFFKHKFLRKAAFFLKKLIYKRSDYLTAVNHEYLNYYNYLKANKLGVVELGLTKKLFDEVKCDLFTKTKFNFLYLGSLGENYLIDDICKFIEVNSDCTIDFFGSGPKEKIIMNYHGRTNGRIKLHEPKALSYFKESNRKYCFGIALYSERSMVKFPTKLYDYWSFSLPVLVNVGGEVKHRIEQNKSLGIYLDSVSELNLELVKKYLINYKSVNFIDDIVINDKVDLVFNKLQLEISRE